MGLSDNDLYAGHRGRDRSGTADLLLTLPLSRSTIYVSTSLVWIVAAACLSAAAWLGLWLGNLAFPLRTPINFARMGIGAVNLLGLYLAIGGIASLISASCNRRGIAVGILLAVLLSSYLTNFLASFIESSGTSASSACSTTITRWSRSEMGLASSQLAHPLRGGNRGLGVRPACLSPQGHPRDVSAV